MAEHTVGTRQELLAAREELLAQEEELTRSNDELSRQRRELPWVRIEKEYSFAIEKGTKTLAKLFDGRSQRSFVLSDGVVYHTYATTDRGLEFMLGFSGLLDRAPNGRDEGDPPDFWIRRHDEY